jgi:branched-chain amino acid transport system ATP-binding protein
MTGTPQRLTALEFEHVVVRFDGLVAIADLAFRIGEGEIVGLIGPNGAGKTTAFNVITRLYRPDEGTIEFDGENLLRVSAHGVIRRGIARTFQNVELFGTMSVLENVLVGAHVATRLRTEREARKLALETLDYVGLGAVARRPASGLPFGTLKRIELARALVSMPRLLLLDEPAGGLNHEEVEELGGFIRRLRDERKVTVLLVEHHMNLVMRASDHVHVLNFGRTIASGSPQEVQRNPEVIEAYLGGEIDETQTVAEAAVAAAELAQEQEEP